MAPLNTQPEPGSKQEQAYTYIRNAIFTNAYPQGMPLTERLLCAECGVSRTPVREALGRLAAERLVEFYPDRGMFVATITARDILEIFELREALESMSARLCARYQEPQTLHDLGGSLTRYVTACQKKQFTKAMDIDLEFHQTLARGSRNREIETTLCVLHSRSRRIAEVILYDNENMDTILVQHQNIFQAISDEDEDLADSVVHKHFQYVIEYLMDHIHQLVKE